MHGVWHFEQRLNKSDVKPLKIKDYLSFYTGPLELLLALPPFIITFNHTIILDYKHFTFSGSQRGVDYHYRLDNVTAYVRTYVRTYIWMHAACMYVCTYIIGIDSPKTEPNTYLQLDWAQV